MLLVVVDVVALLGMELKAKRMRIFGQEIKMKTKEPIQDYKKTPIIVRKNVYIERKVHLKVA
jgi:hypothetical protein